MRLGFQCWLLLLFCLPANMVSQSLTDSLMEVLNNESVDTQRVHLLNDLGWEYKYDDETKARQYLQESINLSEKIGFKKGAAQAFNNLGVVAAIQGDIDQAMTNYERALSLRQELNDQKGVASLYNNLGNLQEEKGDYLGALENLQQSFAIRQQLKDTQRMARVLYNISYVHERMGNYPEALDYVLRHLELLKGTEDAYSLFNAYTLLGNINVELEIYNEALNYYQQALTIAEDIGDDYELAIAYNNLGNMLDDLAEQDYKDKNYSAARPRFSQALDYLQRALSIYEKTDDQEGAGNTNNNLGVVYKNLGSYFLELEQQDSANIYLNRSLSFLKKALTIHQEFNNRKGIIETYNGFGDVYRRLEDSEKALSYTKDYLDLAIEMDDQKFIQKAYKDLSRVYADLKKYKKAYKFRKKYDEIRYERLSEDIVQQNARRQAIFGDYQVQLENERQERALVAQKAQLQRTTFFRNSLIIGALGLLAIALLIFNRYRIKSKANQELAEKNTIIEKEKKRSDDLLLNILPAETARELKENGKAKAKQYASVTVLFTDIVSFTQIAEVLPATELVTLLDDCFRGFDKIALKYGIEKIKTIGDAYMCVGGLPVPNKTHAHDVVSAGIEMQAFVKSYNQILAERGLPDLAIRIGIHTGPVVAGIVGSTKFAYDIWGDTVNLAARMESGGAAGQVNISHTTYEQVKNQFSFKERGKIKVKNKGAIEMYFVNSKIRNGIKNADKIT